MPEKREVIATPPVNKIVTDSAIGMHSTLE